MLMAPEWITREMFAHAVEQVRKASSPPRLDAMRFAELAEGRCVQTLHVGSFEDEAPVLDSMHRDFIPAQGFHLSGKITRSTSPTSARSSPRSCGPSCDNP